MDREDLDTKGLEGYLGAFSGLGAMPTSLNGYGLEEGRYAQELGYLGASPAAASSAGLSPFGTSMEAKPHPVSLVQSYLNALQAKAGNSGHLDKQFQAGWDLYVKVFKEPKPRIAPAKVEGITDTKTVWMNSDAFARLATRGKAAQAKETSAPKPATKTSSSKPVAGNTVAAVSEIQRILVALGHDAAKITDGKFGPTTKAKWESSAKSRKLSASISGKTGAKQATVNANTFATLQKAADASQPAPTPAKGFVITTADAQDVLTRLGYKDKALTDGQFGKATKAAWEESANKRKLDPAIAKKDAKGFQVTVAERTYLMLKADADAKAPPAPTPTPAPIGGSLLSLPPSTVARVTTERLGEVLGRITSAKNDQAVDLQAVFTQVAKDRKLDARLEVAADRKGVLVIKETWDALVGEYDKKASAPEPPKPSEKASVDAAMADIKKRATSSTLATVVRDAFNAAIASGVVKRDPFKGDKWSADYATLLIQMSGSPTGVWKTAWEHMLLPGKLVSKDLKSVKLLPETKKALSKVASDYAAAKKQDEERFEGYTKVNTAQLIEAVNKSFVTSKTFDTSKGAAELADAARTFLEIALGDVKTGGWDKDLVRTSDKTKGVYLKTDVLAKISAAVARAAERMKATEGYQQSMVSNALKESSASLLVDHLQQAFMETVRAGKAGENKKTYSAVKLTGAFDTPTRNAYTVLARTLTIDPSVQQLQRLLVEQLGPQFKTDLVTSARNKVWDDFLKKAVSKKDGKTFVQTLPSIANTVNQTASAYRAQKKEGEIVREKLAEQKNTLSDAVKKSHVIVSILDVQQALLQMLSKKEISGVSGVKLTAKTDASTREGLFQFSGMIFPKGYSIPDTLWAQYLNEVGIGVGENAKVSKGWASANYIALPEAVADLVSKRAGEYIDSKGQSALSKTLAPVPLSNQELRLRFDNPTVISAKSPKKEVAKETVVDFVADEKAAATKKKKDAAAKKKKAAAAAKKKADAAKKKAADAKRKAEAAALLAQKDASNSAALEAARQAALDAQAALEDANRANAEAISAKAEELRAAQEATSAGGAGGAGSDVLVQGDQITIQNQGGPAPEPPFTDTPPTPAPEPDPEPAAEPVKASMGMGWLWASAAGLSLVLLSKSDKNSGVKTGKYSKYATRRRSAGRGR